MLMPTPLRGPCALFTRPLFSHPETRLAAITSASVLVALIRGGWHGMQLGLLSNGIMVCLIPEFIKFVFKPPLVFGRQRTGQGMELKPLFSLHLLLYHYKCHRRPIRGLRNLSITHHPPPDPSKTPRSGLFAQSDPVFDGSSSTSSQPLTHDPKWTECKSQSTSPSSPGECPWLQQPCKCARIPRNSTCPSHLWSLPPLQRGRDASS